MRLSNFIYFFCTQNARMSFYSASSSRNNNNVSPIRKVNSDSVSMTDFEKYFFFIQSTLSRIFDVFVDRLTRAHLLIDESDESSLFLCDLTQSFVDIREIPNRKKFHDETDSSNFFCSNCDFIRKNGKKYL